MRRKLSLLGVAIATVVVLLALLDPQSGSCATVLTSPIPPIGAPVPPVPKECLDVLLEQVEIEPGHYRDTWERINFHDSYNACQSYDEYSAVCRERHRMENGTVSYDYWEGLTLEEAEAVVGGWEEPNSTCWTGQSLLYPVAEPGLTFLSPMVWLPVVTNGQP